MKRKRTLRLVMESILGPAIILWAGQVMFVAAQTEGLLEQLGEIARPKVEKIWEKKFDAEIVDMTFGEAEVTVEEAKKMGIKGLENRRPHEKTTVFYPKLTVTNEAVNFLDSEGNIKKKYLFKPSLAGRCRTTVQIPKAGRYINVVEIDYSEVQSFGKDEKGKEKCTVLNAEGEELWGIKGGGGVISPSGDYMVGLPDALVDTSPLVWYNSQGESRIIKDIPRPHSGCDDYDFTKDGNFFAVTIPDRKIKTVWLLLFDRNGNEIWRKDLDARGGWSVDFSNSNELILVSTYKTDPSEFYLQLFNVNGALLWRRPVVKGAYHAKFSADMNFLVAFSSRHVYLFTTGGKVLWEYEDKNPDTVFTTLDASSDLGFILIGGYTRGEHERVRGMNGYYHRLPVQASEGFHLFNKKGEKLLEKHFAFSSYSYNFHEPKIRISSDGRTLVINTKEGMKVFQNFYVR